MIKVNKVAVMIDEDGVRISLYKTNTKIAEFSNYEIDVPPYYTIGDTINKSTYQAYCKEVVINLLQNDGIEGYYYEEKQKSADATVGMKFGTGEFGGAIKSKLEEILADMEIEYTIRTGEPEVIDRYKGDKMVKNGTIDFTVKIAGTKEIVVAGEIKSGQICKPKQFTYNNTIYTLNETNIKKILKS